MSAKQTLSASLVVLLAASPPLARAEPGAAPGAHPGEVRPEAAAAEDEPRPPRPELPADAPPTPPRRPTGRFEIGGGYATDDGFGARATIAQDSLFGTGKRLALDAAISERQQRFAVRFEDPHLLGSELRLRAELIADDRRFAGFTRRAAGGGLTLATRIAPHVDAFVGYRLEDVTTVLHQLPVEHGTTSRFLPLGGQIGAVRAGVAYGDVDTPLAPTRGATAGLAVEVADRGFGSEHELLRLDGWVASHRAVGPFIVHAGGTFSAIHPRGDSTVPLSERLHFDGSRDVRGLLPGALGPIDPTTGLSLGGDVKTTWRTELELPLIRSIGFSAVGFADAGALFNRRSRRASWGHAFGAGLLWRSPIGPLRFDWAVPSIGDGPRFVFGLGSLF